MLLIALNRGDKVGSLERGKLANFSVFDLPRLSRAGVLVWHSADAFVLREGRSLS